jgi:pyrroline-5-carboxylate reductase
MERIAVLGAGNIGQALARGWVRSGGHEPGSIVLTRRHEEALVPLAEEGFVTTTDNAAAIEQADVVVLATQPSQTLDLLTENAPALRKENLLISVATGIELHHLRERVTRCEVIRAMPNTAVHLGESMTCIARDGVPEAALDRATALFDEVGRTALVDEDQMAQATALCACGIAFFLRAIRAASQGGIEIGFHAEEALAMAAQTARGAASLLLQLESHPESEIDKVTTPRGCTIAGLNRMEHEGFSSAMIRGIVTSSEIASGLGPGTKNG